MEPWLAYLLIFALAVAAAHQVQSALAGALGDRALVRQRFGGGPAGGGSRGEQAELRRRASRLRDRSLFAGLIRLHRQSGVGLGLQGVTFATVALALLLWVVLPIPGGALRIVVSVAIASVLAGLYLRIRRARRLARFAEQLPEVIDVVVRSLRAGHPLAVSLALVAREMPEPAGPEFALVVDEVNYGRSIPDALDNLYDRVGYPELRFFVAAISIATQTGGNLGEILSRLARMLRDRFRLRRRIRALSAEGRFSGLALSALPVILFGIINVVSAAYYAEFWTSPSAPTIVAISIGLLLVGNTLIFRLVNFRV